MFGEKFLVLHNGHKSEKKNRGAGDVEIFFISASRGRKFAGGKTDIIAQKRDVTARKRRPFSDFHVGTRRAF